MLSTCCTSEQKVRTGYLDAAAGQDLPEVSVVLLHSAARLGISLGEGENQGSHG